MDTFLLLVWAAQWYSLSLVPGTLPVGLKCQTPLLPHLISSTGVELIPEEDAHGEEEVTFS